MFKRKIIILMLATFCILSTTSCAPKVITTSEAPLVFVENPVTEQSPLAKKNTALSVSISPKSKKTSTGGTVLTPIALTTQEKEIASMIGEYFTMFHDEKGTASIGVKLYKSGELDTDFGYIKSKESVPDTKLMVSSGKMDKINFNWQVMSLSKKETYQESLSASFNQDARSFSHKAVMNTEALQVNTRSESVLGYIAFREGELQWNGNQKEITLGSGSTLAVLQQDLKMYQYCYIITAIVE